MGLKVPGVRTDRSLRAISAGEEVWFVKSMRRCRVVELHADGNYTVARLDNGKRLTATRTGLCRANDQAELHHHGIHDSTIRSGTAPALLPVDDSLC